MSTPPRWMSPVWEQAVTVPCPHCGSVVGLRCVTISDWCRKPHRIRVAVAAHNDPALDAFGPRIGPCGLCGVPGLPQRHRVVDAIAACIGADQGDTNLDLAEEYGVSAEAAAVVREWALRWPEAWK